MITTATIAATMTTILIADDPRYGDTTAFTGWDAIRDAFRTMWGMGADEIEALRDESSSHIYTAEHVSADIYETTAGTRYHVGEFSEDGMAEASEAPHA